MEGGYERGAGGQAWPLKAITLLTLCVGAKNVEVSDGEQGIGIGEARQGPAGCDEEAAAGVWSRPEAVRRRRMTRIGCCLTRQNAGHQPQPG